MQEKIKVSNQFQKIKFWLIPPKEPFDITVSRNDVKKSLALYIWTNIERKKIHNLYNLFNNLKDSARARKSPCLTLFSSYN